MKPRLFTNVTTLGATDIFPLIRDLGAGVYGEKQITKADLAVALGVPTTSDYVQNQSGLTGLTGGGGTKLDGLTTVGVAVGKLVAVTIAGATYFYQLVAGTTAEASPSIIRPDDYAGGTNEKIWKLGALTLPGNPANALEAAPKQYVDAGDALNLPLAGGTLTGALVAPRITVPIVTLTYAATTDIDFNAGDYQDLTLTGNVTLTFSNLAAGKNVTVFLSASGADRTITLPAGVVFLGSAASPITLLSGKEAALSFTAKSTTAASVRAAYSAQA